MLTGVSSIGRNRSGIGARRGGLAQFGTDRGQGFFRRADAAVLRIEGTLVNGEGYKQFAPVEIVLRIGRQPSAWKHFVTLLHEMAALVDFGEKTADRDVVGDFNFHASQLSGGLVDPDKATDFGEDRSGARASLVGGIGLHAVFAEQAIPAGFASEEGKQERGAGRLDQLGAVFLFLGNFFVGVVLGAPVFGGPDERAFELLQLGAIGCRFRGLSVGSDRDASDASSRGNGAEVLDLRGSPERAFAGFQALQALANSLCFVVFLLVGDDAIEERALLRIGRRNRRRGQLLGGPGGRRDRPESCKKNECARRHGGQLLKLRPQIGFSAGLDCCIPRSRGRQKRRFPRAFL